MLELERTQIVKEEAEQQRSLMLGPAGGAGGPGLAGFSAQVPVLHRAGGN